MVNSSIFLLILVLTTASHADVSESDKFCSALDAKLNSMPNPMDPSGLSGDTKQKIAQLTELRNAILDLRNRSKPFIEKKATFKEFAAAMAAEKRSVPANYEHQYWQSYLLKYCGQTTTEASYELQDGQKVLIDKKTKYELQFDPKSHPIYEEIQSGGSVK
jgi:hypothetical protein